MMNDKFTNVNPEDEKFVEQLNALSEQTHLDPRFANELERKLKAAHKPKTVWLKAPSSSILPSLGWVALVVVMGLALIWTIETLVPKPQPAAIQTPSVIETSTPSQDSVIQDATPDPNRPGYDFRGAKLTVDTTLPQSPAQANIYRLQAYQPASAEYAQTLASQFGIQGEIYSAERSYPAQSGFMVTDGKQQLVVYGLNDYQYTADIVQSSRNYNGFPNDNAESIIREYLSSHGLDYSYRVAKSDALGGYALQQVSPDGMLMQFDSQTQPAMRITLDSNGNVLTVLATMMNYDPAPIGSFGIISADEALQMVLDDTLPGGKLETSSSGGPGEDFIPPQLWYRDYPDNQTVTIFGNVSSSRPVDSSKPAIVFIDSVSTLGNIAGMENLEYYTFVKAAGTFVMDGDVRKFNVESWDTNAQSAYLTGTVRRDGDQFILTTDEDGSQYPIMAAPADLPLDIDPTKSQLSFEGMIVDGEVDWRSITFYPDASQMGGGGGGGGYGFYKLNLSGSPIPFPTSIPEGQGYTQAEIAGFLKYTIQDGDTLGKIAQTYNVSMDDLVRVNNLTDGNMIYVGMQLVIPGVPGPTHLDGEPGTLMVNIYAKPDGRQRVVYAFTSQKDQTYYQLTGDNLEPLQQLHGHPISIWGSISYDQYGAPFLAVEKFEELYPGLQFQLVNGTQEMKEVNGESLVLITDKGITYVQMGNTGGYPDSNYDPQSKGTLIEGVIVPGETYAGYPTIRVFSIGPAIDPTTGKPFEFPHSAATPEVLPDPFGNADQYVSPDVVIETVELVYYSINPSSQVAIPEGDTYVQPAWHFRGKFSNGDSFDVLIQALKQEYLSPELDQNITLG
jgi:LysM repeat protein